MSTKEMSIEDLFCAVDDFCRLFLPDWRHQLSQKLFETLLEQDLQLITKRRKGMQNQLLPLADKLLWRKRALIETINDPLKNIS
jgi:hypothetical protein